MNSAPAIAICSRAGIDSVTEQQLATELNLPLLASDDATLHNYQFFLRYETAGLTLYQNKPGAPGGLCIDFTSAQLQRRTNDKLRRQNLSKAVGLKGKDAMQILDATAGLGKDAWLLASGGAQVHLLERSRILVALLQDAFQRGQAQLPLRSPLQNMQLQYADFFAVANTLPVFDVVYLDPMFPPNNKHARAKKDMYLLQALLGTADCDEFTLLEEARKHARRRVVVKRAKLSPYLAGSRPDIEFKGSSNRYDVYLCNHEG